MCYVMDIIINKLFELKDDNYQEFSAKLVPNIDGNKIIGIRIPMIRNLAKEIKNEEYIDDFLNELPHKYQEEYILHGMLLGIKYKDIDILLNKLDIFLEYVNNWVITDTISPKLFKKYPDKVYEYIIKWINSNNIPISYLSYPIYYYNPFFDILQYIFVIFSLNFHSPLFSQT